MTPTAGAFVPFFIPLIRGFAGLGNGQLPPARYA